MSTPPPSSFALLARDVRVGEYLWITPPTSSTRDEIRTKVLQIIPETGPLGEIRLRFVCVSGSFSCGADTTVHLAL